MDYIAEQYRKMRTDAAIEVNKAADSFIRGLYEHAENGTLSEEDKNQINKFLRRKILNGSFRSRQEREITLTILSKLKDIFSS